VTDAPATIAAITALIVAVGAFVLNFLKERAAEKATAAALRAAEAAELAIVAAEANNTKLIEIDGKIFNLGKAVDGRLTALIKSLEENANIRVTAAKASGKLEGKAEAVAEASDKAAAADDGGRRDGDAS
jgi:hypothetical protein